MNDTWCWRTHYSEVEVALATLRGVPLESTDFSLCRRCGHGRRRVTLRSASWQAVSVFAYPEHTLGCPEWTAKLPPDDYANVGELVASGLRALEGGRC